MLQLKPLLGSIETPSGDGCKLLTVSLNAAKQRLQAQTVFKTVLHCEKRMKVCPLKRKYVKKRTHSVSGRSTLSQFQC